MPISKDLLERFRTTVFVETGTYQGDGIAAAIAAGFDHVISIEVSEDLHGSARQRFPNAQTVQLIRGDTRTALWPAIQNQQHRMTFWLDAHYSGGNTSFVEGQPEYPVLEELTQIKRHHRNDHIILIDDLRLFNHDFAMQVFRTLKEINGAYHVELCDGWVPCDIISAHL